MCSASCSGKIRGMDRASLETRLRVALTAFIVDEYSLWNKSAGANRSLPVSERACCFQLGLRLRPMIERSWDLDLEYNRQDEGDATRSKRTEEDLRMPDLIIHHRGKREQWANLLCLELKTQRLGDTCDAEKEKLRRLVKEHNYRHGCLLNLDIRQPSKEHPGIRPAWCWIDGRSESRAEESTNNMYKEVYRRSVLQAVIGRSSSRDEDSSAGA